MKWGIAAMVYSVGDTTITLRSFSDESGRLAYLQDVLSELNLDLESDREN